VGAQRQRASQALRDCRAGMARHQGQRGAGGEQAAVRVLQAPPPPPSPRHVRHPAAHQVGRAGASGCAPAKGAVGRAGPDHSQGQGSRTQRRALLREQLHPVVGVRAADARARRVEAALRGAPADGLARSGKVGGLLARGAGSGSSQGALHCRLAPLRHRERHERLPRPQGGDRAADQAPGACHDLLAAACGRQAARVRRSRLAAGQGRRGRGQGHCRAAGEG
jgi:hypothetical protein